MKVIVVARGRSADGKETKWPRVFKSRADTLRSALIATACVVPLRASPLSPLLALIAAGDTLKAKLRARPPEPLEPPASRARSSHTPTRSDDADKSARGTYHVKHF